MTLIDVVNLRSIVINQKIIRKDFWNTIYDLLGKYSCCSPKSQNFKDGLKSVRRYLTKGSPETILIHVMVKTLDRMGFLIVNLDKEMRLPIYKGREFRNVVVCVTEIGKDEHNEIMEELLHSYGSISIDDIMKSSKSKDHAFYLIKKYIVEKNSSEAIESEQFKHKPFI